LRVPTLNSNDESYVLVGWLVADGAPVLAGDAVASIETSKAVDDLVVDAPGYLSHAVEPMSTCRPGEIVGHLRPAKPTGAGPPPSSGQQDSGQGGMVVTRPAQELMDTHGVTSEAVAGLGKKLIRRADVESLLGASVKPGAEAAGAEGAGAEGQSRPLPAHQLAVARVVSRSHATIPPAFTVIKVVADEMLRLQRAETARFIGIPEQVIKAVAQAAGEFPDCLAGIGDDLTITPATSVDIGVTIDVGNGLYVPVLRAADTLTVADIAGRMMYFRARLLRGRLSEQDLGPASIVLALHQSPGIVLAQPIIYPGQACTLSLAALDQELRLGPEGQVSEHSYFYLGLSYDHRVINGRQAAAFLTAIRDRLQEVPADFVSGPDAPPHEQQPSAPS
ncbi:MAG: 2-oxo acid dehydrogenase subunit E2, partial [Streptosporangiaceae bacterium]